jgi:hypothetical protein
MRIRIRNQQLKLMRIRNPALLNLLTMNPLNSQFHSVTLQLSPLPSVRQCSVMLMNIEKCWAGRDKSAGGAGARLELPVLPRP